MPLSLFQREILDMIANERRRSLRHAWILTGMFVATLVGTCVAGNHVGWGSFFFVAAVMLELAGYTAYSGWRDHFDERRHHQELKKAAEIPDV